MGKLRSVNTQFWSDPWIEELSPTEKLLYLYFITNEKTNMLGVYELSIRKISFETGIDKKTIENALERFESIGKVKYTKNYIVLLNFAKHQNYNTNMKKSAIDIFNDLPKELNIKQEAIDKSNPLEGFERVCKRLGMVRKIEVESESEIEDEKDIIDWDKLLETFNKISGKNCRVVNQKARKGLRARLNEGYTKEDIVTAIHNIANDKFHQEHNLKYLTLEFISKPDKLGMWSTQKPKE